MTGPHDPAEPERPDLDAYRTGTLDDPELVAAYEVENEAVRLDGETIGVAWALGLIPLMLVLLLLSGLLGDWVWDALLPLFIAGAACVYLAKLGLFRRYASALPIHLPGLGVLRGARKRKVLLQAGALFVVVLAVDRFGVLGHLRRWFVGWFGGWLATL